MRINDVTAEHMIYFEPEQFIQKRVLPFKTVCWSCKTSLTIDMIDDLRAHDAGTRWNLALDCPICGVGVQIKKQELSDRAIDKHFNKVVDFYLARYPKSYVFFHNDDDGSHVGMTLVGLFITFIISGMISAVSAEEGDVNLWAYYIWLGSILAAVWVLWSCISPYTKKKKVQAVKKRVGIQPKSNVRMQEAFDRMIESQVD